MMHYTYERLRAGLALIPALQRSMGPCGPDPLPVELLSVDHYSPQGCSPVLNACALKHKRH